MTRTARIANNRGVDLDLLIEQATGTEWWTLRERPVPDPVEEVYWYVRRHPPQRTLVEFALDCVVTVPDSAAPILDICNMFLRTGAPECRFVAPFVETLWPVARLMKIAPPAVLVIHSNWLLYFGPLIMAALVAASPSTRVLVITAHQQAIDVTREVAEPLGARVDGLLMPFEREVFVRAVRGENVGR